jgi:hypothetical protein
MQCSKGLGVGNPRLIRHNLMLPLLEDLYTRMGFEFDCRPAFMRIPGAVSGTGEDKLLDFVARCPGDRDISVGVDLTVIATMAAKYLTPALAGNRARNSKPSPFAATSKAETSKHSKYDRPVTSMNPPLKFVAIGTGDSERPRLRADSRRVPSTGSGTLYKVDASRRAEKCRSLRVKVEGGGLY